MRSDYITTPFGRRPMSLGMLANQQLAGQIEAGTRRNKWKLFRAICEARSALGVSDRALTVLDALLTFHPHDDIAGDQNLTVFPSNAQLSLRARGMAPATLRRHIAVLVDSGLIVRRDSANGKRFARRSRTGTIDEAYGFNLSPLLARAGEIENLAARIVADRELLRGLKQRLSVYRRDVSKLIQTALRQGEGEELYRILAIYNQLVSQIPTPATIEALTPVLNGLERLSDEVVKYLGEHINSDKISATESQSERHKEDSKNLIPIESEIPSDRMKALVPPLPPTSSGWQLKPATAGSQRRFRQTAGTSSKGCQQLSISMILRICPKIVDYSPGGDIRSWRDLMTAATVVHTTLAISHSAYEEACKTMGLEMAATVIACILERLDHIASPGGYLRDLTRRVEHGTFSIEPMLMALMRSGNKEASAAGKGGKLLHKYRPQASSSGSRGALSLPSREFALNTALTGVRHRA